MRLRSAPAALLTLFICVDVGLAPPGEVDVEQPLVEQFGLGESGKVHRSVFRGLAEGDGTARVWVFFTDKGPGDRTEALRALETTYNARAMERRRLRRTAPGLFDERDLVVAEPYLEGVRRTGASVHITSRWLNAASVSVTAEQLAEIAALKFVGKIQIVRRFRTRPHGERRADGPPTSPLGGFYGLSEDQLNQINVIAMHEAAYTAEGVVVGVLDTGFRRTHDAYNHPDHPLQVVAEWDFVDNDPDTAPEPGDPGNQHNHGTWILGTLGAYLPGSLVGGAYDASFILAKVEDVDGEYPAEEDMFVAGVEFVEANGGDVATSSVVIFDHYEQRELDGMTSVMTIGYNVAAENGVHCFQGAGNDGHDNDPNTSHLLPPADAFLVNTCGAVDANGNIANFSSDGPTADGRLKPEILARGVATWTTHSNDGSSYSSLSGTSLSTPLCAAAAACLVQAHPGWTVQQMRNALYQTGSYYEANRMPDPLYVHGYGIIDAWAAGQTDPPHADLNADFRVGVEDLLILLAAWGPCPKTGFCVADVNHDGVVDTEDLLILLGDWD